MALKTLSVDVRVGETVTIGGPASIRLEAKSGGTARLSIMADESVKIARPRNPAADQARAGILSADPAQERGAASSTRGAGVPKPMTR